MQARSEQLEGAITIHKQTPKLWSICSIGGRKAVGVLSPGIREGDHVRMRGKMEHHPNFGEQFRFRTCEAILPSGLSGVQRYLDRHFKHVGPKIAAEILTTYGETFFEILESDPDNVAERIRGITRDRAQKMRDTWLTIKRDHEADLFFSRCNLTPSMMRRVYAAFIKDFDTYEKLSDIPVEDRLRVVEKIRKNPYSLIEKVEGIAFARSDTIARSLSFDFNSPFRIRAGIFHTLIDASQSGGHCHLPERVLCKKAAATLGVSSEQASEQLQTLIHEEKLIRDDACLFLPRLYEMELRVAKGLKSIAAAPRFRVMAQLTHTDWNWLVKKQRQAIEHAMNHNMLVITGGPGTGKTSLLQKLLMALGDTTVELAAPSGKAAKRISEQTGRPARTIHRLLEYHPEIGFRVHAKNPIDAEVVIIDETSMVDLSLMDALVDAVDPKTTQLIFVGDVDQLPSVGAGSVLSDIIDSGICPVVRLTDILRQDEASSIVTNAHRVNQGQPLVTDNKRDFFTAYVDDQQGIVALIKKILTIMPEKLGLDPRNDIQILCPARKALVGVENLNHVASELLNRRGQRIPGSSIKVGDRVIQRRNNYHRRVFSETLWKTHRDRVIHQSMGGDSIDDLMDAFDDKDSPVQQGVFNGDRGRIIEYVRHPNLVIVRFDGDRGSNGTVSAYTTLAADDELLLSWASTIHRSQGSEYPAVIIPLHAAHYVMLQRNLFYTAITRASRAVFLVGSKKAITIAIRNTDQARRFTRLSARLRRTEP